MTQSTPNPPLEQLRAIVKATISSADTELRHINRQIHERPELAWEEFFAHATITDFLEARGFAVQRSTYGISTSFEAEVGTGGRIAIICAEYDALPEIGHACGHNLIATSALAAFLAAAEALREIQKTDPDFQGRVRILGTPAEEGGGGKAKLIEAGAFADKDISIAVTAHPVNEFQLPPPSSADGPNKKSSGLAGFRLIALHSFKTEFRGQSAHAAAAPWEGHNALDAAVAAYSSVGLLRQQIRPDERVHAVIDAGGTVPNVIPDYTRMSWMVRSPTIARADALLKRVKACVDTAAAAAGCEVEYTVSPTYMNMRANNTICAAYVDDMASFGQSVELDMLNPIHASTDMGNVSHVVPSFQGAFIICRDKGVAMHHPRFTAASATDEAHDAALQCAQGMAMLAVRTLVDEDFAKRAWRDFGEPDE